MQFDFDGNSGPKSSNLPEYTVSELSNRVKRVVESEFSYVRVRGELGRVSTPGSGHIYLDLKDDKTVLAGVIWRGNAGKLSVRPEQGLEVVVTGKLTTFPGQSRYQIIIDSLEPAGQGALMALLEERKKKLAREGLMDESAKQKLPFMPRVVGIITSPTGAVIRDMMHGFHERFPVHVLVWPVRVQGETAAREIAAGIAGFNQISGSDGLPRPDVLIVARGGGSLEDLWSFNEEIVARAAAASQIPLISAVGHETDWTLIDYVADARAPTPTKAAEWAVPKYSELLSRTADLHARQVKVMHRLLESRRLSLRGAGRGLPRLGDLLGLPRQRLDGAGARLSQGLKAFAGAKRQDLMRFEGRLQPFLLRQRLSRYAERVEIGHGRMRQGILQRMALRRERLSRLAGGLRGRALKTGLLTARRQLDDVRGRGNRVFENRLQNARARLDGLASLLSSLSYQGVLARGFAIVRDGEGRMVRSARLLAAGDRLELEFADGRADCLVETLAESEPGADPETKGRAGRGEKAATQPALEKKKKGAKSSDDGGAQGSLF